jgi:hypothetical protein
VFLGHLVYLEVKTEGDNSMLNESSGHWKAIEGGVLRDPRDMAKAELPETQSPGVKAYAHRNDACNRCCTMLGHEFRPWATSVVQEHRPARAAKGMSGGPVSRFCYVRQRRTAGSPTGREPYW